MALFSKNRFKGLRFHYLPGDQPPPRDYVKARSYVNSCPEAHYLPLTQVNCQPVAQFPLKRSARFQTPRFDSPFVVVLPHGRVVEGDGLVVTRENQLLVDVTPHLGHAYQQHPIFQHRSLANLRESEQRVAVVATPQSDRYFQWMCTLLPRIELLRQSNQDYDQLFLPPLKRPFQWETLEQMKIDWDKVIVGGGGLHLKSKHLVVPSLPGPEFSCPPWACEFLRQLFLPSESPSSNQLLYIRRRGTRFRQIFNEDELANMLSQRGFEGIEPQFLSVTEQAKLFASARCIVAPHGSGLTNLLFCSTGTSVLEIFHPKWINDCYWQISKFLGLDHQVLFGRRHYCNFGKRINDRNHDMVIDLSKLSDTLDRMGI